MALFAAAALLFLRCPRDVVAQLLSFSIVLASAPFAQLLHVAPLVSTIIGLFAQILLLTALLLFPDGRLVRAAHAAIVVDHQLLAARDVDVGAVQTSLSTWQEPVEGEGQLHTNRDDPLFPMRIPLYADSVGSVGWMLLGPCPDGSFYGKDERDTLLAIAEPVARAIVVARQREEREERDTKREEREVGRGREIGGLANRMTAVETRLTGIAPQAV